MRIKPNPCFMLVRTDTPDFSGMNLIRSRANEIITAMKERPLREKHQA